MLYTSLDMESLQNILQQYAIAPLTKWSILEGGAENTNYLLETENQQYILTICERKTFEETTILVDLLQHLAKHQFTTTAVIPSKTGLNISSFEHKPIVLKSYLAGTIVPQPSLPIIARIGSAIGQLHLVPAPHYLPKVYSYGEQTFSQLTASEVRHPFVDWLRDIHTYLKREINTTLPRTLIHGDIFFSNVIIDEHHTPTIIDFEEACYYYRMYDVGMAIVGLCKENGTINFTKADQLISSYEKVISLTKAEKESVKIFIAYAATATAFWRFRQFNIIVPTSAHQDTYIEMKKIAEQMREEVER